MVRNLIRESSGAMKDAAFGAVLEKPVIYLVRMVVFLILAGIVAAVLFPQIRSAFMANPGLNGLILFTLFLGVIYTFRMVIRLFPEVNWVNHFRIADPSLDIPYTPRLLAPMAALLRDRRGTMVLTPMSLRSLLDSLAARLDESRDISRYLIGLLVFLGLLGTFWGLLQTISSVGEVIRNLILGFLDLQAAQAQNRFYNDLEDWLATITDIEAGEGGAFAAPHYLSMDMTELQEGIERINETLARVLEESPPGVPAAGTEAMNRLAEAVAGVVEQMREEQKIMRAWADRQSAEQEEIRRMLAEWMRRR